MIPTMDVSAAKKVKLSRTTVTIYVGKTVTLKLKNNKNKVRWSSSNRNIATVTKKGKVKGKKAGKTTITAKVGKKKYRCRVTIRKKFTKHIRPQPTTKQTEQPITKPSKQELSITDYYNKLKNFIISNGLASNNFENKYMQIYHNDLIYECSLIYNKNTDMYRFEVVANMSEKGTIWFNMSKSPIIKYEISSVFFNYTAQSNFEGAKYTKNKNTTVGYVINSNRGASSEDEIKDYANTYLRLNFVLMDRVIGGKVKISLANLGMTDYNRDVAVKLPYIKDSNNNVEHPTTVKPTESTTVKPTEPITEQPTTVKPTEPITEQPTTEQPTTQATPFKTKEVYGGVEVSGYKGYDSNVVIPNTINGKKVVAVGERAFVGYSELESITIPDGVVSIGNEAFYKCNGLKKIILPNSLKSIGDNVFNECCTLSEITIPESVTNIGESAFSGCKLLYSIIIPKGVTNIKNGTFKYCSNLTDITIPNGLTRVGESAFEGCYKLIKIDFPEGVTSIEKNTFRWWCKYRSESV